MQEKLYLYLFQYHLCEKNYTQINFNLFRVSPSSSSWEMHVSVASLEMCEDSKNFGNFQVWI